MVLDGENDRVVTGHEGVVLDDLDDVQEPDLAGDGVPVEDERHPVRAVPAVQLDTSGILHFSFCFIGILSTIVYLSISIWSLDTRYYLKIIRLFKRKKDGVSTTRSSQFYL